MKIKIIMVDDEGVIVKSEDVMDSSKDGNLDDEDFDELLDFIMGDDASYSVKAVKTNTSERALK